MRNATSGVVFKSTAAKLAESNALSLSNSFPPCPTNNRTPRVRGGSLLLDSTSSRRSPTDLLAGISRPSCSMTPLPKASTWTQTLRGALSLLSEGCVASPTALVAASAHGETAWAPAVAA